MGERPPLPVGSALRALGRCVVRAVALLVRGRVHQPTTHVGRRIHFGDGTSAVVYRETVVDRAATASPAVLVVGFELRRIRGERWHRLFRIESLLNTLLFIGFPGFVSKLWLTHDGRGTYRGVYEWDGPMAATEYAGALWRALALISVRASIRHVVVPGVGRDDLLRDPSVLDEIDVGAADRWWRPCAVEPADRQAERPPRPT